MSLKSRIKQLEQKPDEVNILVVEAEFIEILNDEPITKEEFEELYLNGYEKKPKVQWIEK